MPHLLYRESCPPVWLNPRKTVSVSQQFRHPQNCSSSAAKPASASDSKQIISQAPTIFVLVEGMILRFWRWLQRTVEAVGSLWQSRDSSSVERFAVVPGCRSSEQRESGIPSVGDRKFAVWPSDSAALAVEF